MKLKYKDTDDFARALRFRTVPFAVAAAALVFAGCLAGGVSLLRTLVATLAAGIATALIPLVLADRSGRVGSNIYMPSGSSLPAPREYSLADSLAARGMVEEAAEAYQLLSEDFPDDPEPRVRLARLLRDRSARYDDAAHWFRAALAARSLDAPMEAALLREISELYIHKTRTATRAIPFLARLAGKYPSHPSGIWARAEIAEIKERMREEYDRDG